MVELRGPLKKFRSPPPLKSRNYLKLVLKKLLTSKNQLQHKFFSCWYFRKIFLSPHKKLVPPLRDHEIKNYLQLIRMLVFSQIRPKAIAVFHLFIGNQLQFCFSSAWFLTFSAFFCSAARIRGSAASLATAFNWSCTFVVTKTFVNLNQLIGAAGTYWLFAAICLMSMVFVVVWVPETQGKSLEDIERNLTGGPKGPVRHVRRMSSIAHLKPLPMAV